MGREDKYIEMLLKALDDEQVRKKLIHIWGKESRENVYDEVFEDKNNSDSLQELQELQKLKEQNDLLQQQLSQKESKIDERNAQITQKDQEIQALKEELEEQKKLYAQQTRSSQKKLKEIEQEKQIVQEELKEYHTQFGMIEKIQTQYKKLSETKKDNLKNIIPGSSMIQILISGTQECNIEGLWKYCSYNKKDDEFECLKEIFQGLFQVFQTCHEGYRLEVPDIGEEYDSESHAKDGDCKIMSGYISEVILAGYSSSHKIIQKPIVKIEA